MPKDLKEFMLAKFNYQGLMLINVKRKFIYSFADILREKL